MRLVIQVFLHPYSRGFRHVRLNLFLRRKLHRAWKLLLGKKKNQLTIFFQFPFNAFFSEIIYFLSHSALNFLHVNSSIVYIDIKQTFPRWKQIFKKWKITMEYIQRPRVSLKTTKLFILDTEKKRLFFHKIDTSYFIVKDFPTAGTIFGTTLTADQNLRENLTSGLLLIFRDPVIPYPWFIFMYERWETHDSPWLPQV